MMLRKQLYTLGVIPSSRSGTPDLQELLRKRSDYVQSCDNAMEGSIWSIIVECDGFWEDVKDFRLICVLCRVCKIFSYALQSHEKAWTMVSKNHSYMNDRMLAYIFRVPLKYLPGNSSMYAATGGFSFKSKTCPIHPVLVLQMSYEVNNGACGFFAKRKFASSKYCERQLKEKQQTIRWPKDVRNERIWPHFVDFLLFYLSSSSRWTGGKDALVFGTVNVAHGTLCKFMHREAKAHNQLLTKRDITDFMILCQLCCKDYMVKTKKQGDPLIQYVWKGGRLFWRIMVREVVLFRYPYAGNGIMRKGLGAA